MIHAIIKPNIPSVSGEEIGFVIHLLFLVTAAI